VTDRALLLIGESPANRKIWLSDTSPPLSMATLDQPFDGRCIWGVMSILPALPPQNVCENRARRHFPAGRHGMLFSFDECVEFFSEKDFAGETEVAFLEVVIKEIIFLT